MNLPNPIPGSSGGPQYALDLQSCLNVIDQHNHSAGSGQQIQPNGLNINGDLSFQSNNAYALRSTRFTPQVSPIANAGLDVGILYVSGNELYYNDVTGGHQVPITLNGNVNATSSGISSGAASAAFVGGVLEVKSSSTNGANIKIQNLILTNNADYTNTLTLQAPNLAGGSIAETLPPIPLVTSFMTMDSSGNMATSVALLGALTTANLDAAANIVGTQLSATADILGSQLSASAGIVAGQIAAFGLSIHSTVQSYNSGSSTWVAPAGVTTIMVEICGGGGGGGGGGQRGPGADGSAGTATTFSGSFGTLTGYGGNPGLQGTANFYGNGGTPVAPGGSGGSGISTDFYRGGDGASGNQPPASDGAGADGTPSPLFAGGHGTTQSYGGGGAATILAAGGAGGIRGGVGTAGTQGSGGGGGGCGAEANGGGDADGGAGGGGGAGKAIVIVLTVIPGNSYTYSIGAGGAGGAGGGGAGGFAGGAGGAGGTGFLRIHY